MYLSADLNTVWQPYPDRCIYLQIGIKVEANHPDQCICLSTRMHWVTSFRSMYRFANQNQFRYIHRSENSNTSQTSTQSRSNGCNQVGAIQDRCIYLQIGMKVGATHWDRCIYLSIWIQLDNLIQIDVSISLTTIRINLDTYINLKIQMIYKHQLRYIDRSEDSNTSQTSTQSWTNVCNQSCSNSSSSMYLSAKWNEIGATHRDRCIYLSIWTYNSISKLESTQMHWYIALKIEIHHKHQLRDTHR